MNPTYAKISLKNLIFNYNSLRKKAKRKVMAVVKADAYGHGMVECVEALRNSRNKPEYYGVALESEAVELRNANIVKEPILCFAPIKEELISTYAEHNILPSITSVDQVIRISKLKLSKKLKLHININTGMNRMGISYADAFLQIRKLINNPKIEIDGIYTHFACSDEKDKTFTYLQINRFVKLIKALKDNDINIGIVHAANSGAIIDMPESYFDMVRPGISLYGYYPSLETSESIKLKPVMSVYSHLSTITRLNKGDSVGYGRLFKTADTLFSGSVPIGYADGFSRALSNKAKVIIANKMFDQIGRVSMDRININLTNTPPRLNSRVILIGSSNDKKIDAWDWSKLLKTIPYEITCNISKRVPRIYV